MYLVTEESVDSIASFLSSVDLRLFSATVESQKPPSVSSQSSELQSRIILSNLLEEKRRSHEISKSCENKSFRLGRKEYFARKLQ